MSLKNAYSSVIDTLHKRPNGVSFNKLANDLKGKISRVKLVETLGKLLEDGVLEVKEDVRHKQKKVFKLREEVREKIKEINEVERSLMNDVSNLHLILKKYAEIAKEIKNESIRRYIEFRLNSLILELFRSFMR